MTHWPTTFDPDDGDPIGALCDCEIGDDHDGAGNLSDPGPVPADHEKAWPLESEGLTGMAWDNLGHGGG